MKHSFILLLSIFLLSAIYVSGQKVKLTLSQKDTVSLTKTSIENILEDLDKFNNIWVEFEGTYKFGYEFYAIFPKTNPGKPQDTFYGLWTAFNMGIFKNLSLADSLAKLNDKKVRMKGRISKIDKGHLGKFAASIKDIFYIEEL